jgi:hypothetical protein
MDWVVLDFLAAAFGGLFTETGRRMLWLLGLQSNVVAETLLGLLVWILAILLVFALFAALV